MMIEEKDLRHAELELPALLLLTRTGETNSITSGDAPVGRSDLAIDSEDIAASACDDPEGGSGNNTIDKRGEAARALRPPRQHHARNGSYVASRSG